MTSTRRRGKPLRADGSNEAEDPISDWVDEPPATPPRPSAAPPAAPQVSPPVDVPVDAPVDDDVDEYGIGHSLKTRERTADDRRSFAEAVAALRTGGGSLNLSERTLMVVGGVIAPLGLLFVLLGWVGASRTPNLFEQVPYLISGGLFGLALVFLGSFFYFAHWITELVKEHRTQSVALLEAIERLQAEVSGQSPVVVSGGDLVPATSGSRDAVLVATARGSMLHRADCAVVSGKDGLRTVTEDDGLVPCKLCEPFADD